MKKQPFHERLWSKLQRKKPPIGVPSLAIPGNAPIGIFSYRDLTKRIRFDLPRLQPLKPMPPVEKPPGSPPPRK